MGVKEHVVLARTGVIACWMTSHERSMGGIGRADERKHRAATVFVQSRAYSAIIQPYPVFNSASTVDTLRSSFP